MSDSEKGWYVMTKDCVKQLTRQGISVEINAAEILTSEDSKKINNLDAPPRSVNEEMVRRLRERMPDVNSSLNLSDFSYCVEMIEVEFVSSVPEFTGTDLNKYGSFEDGDVAKIPESNASRLSTKAKLNFFRRLN